jgi:predicted dehydrogenase
MTLRRRDFLRNAAIGTSLLVATRARAQRAPVAPPNQQSADAKLPEVVKRKLGVAIVGLGKLALEEVMPAFGQCTHARPVALVSGHADKARRVAAAYGIPDASIYDYAKYDRIVADPSIDAVYIILPNSMHAEYTIRALEAGKHVLCEKPMAVSVAEAERMIAAAKRANRQLAVAYRLQYEPHHLRAIEMCRRKELGELKLIRATNCQDTRAPNIRLSRALGGGPLADVGIYCVNAARYLTGEMPVEVSGVQHRSTEPRFAEVPESVAFTLRFASGLIVEASCSLGTAESRHLEVIAQRGVLRIDNAFTYRGLELTIKRAPAEGGRPREELEPQIENKNHFQLELDAFAQAVLGDKPVKTPGQDGLADLRVMAAIEKSIRESRPMKV